jgi:hypothetical protein
MRLAEELTGEKRPKDWKTRAIKAEEANEEE